MDTSMHGKKIKFASWPDSGNETGQHLQSGEKCGTLTFSATYHGDHDEFWIVQTKDGEEVARYNARYVETITWAESSLQHNKAVQAGAGERGNLRLGQRVRK
jgi:hypothetical protein